MAAEPKAKGHPSGCPFVLEARGEIDILDGRDYCRRTAKRPFWAAARVRRTSVFTAGENLGAGAALPTPSIQIPKGGSRLWRLEPKKKDMTIGHVFLFGGGEGSRTPVRKHFNGTFSGADGYCGSLPSCSPPPWQAVTPGSRVRVIMRGRGNSYPPHGRHINDAFPGLWPPRFRRPPLIRQQ